MTLAESVEPHVERRRSKLGAHDCDVHPARDADLGELERALPVAFVAKDAVNDLVVLTQTRVLRNGSCLGRAAHGSRSRQQFRR
jgi:hypothetical protein